MLAGMKRCQLDWLRSFSPDTAEDPVSAWSAAIEHLYPELYKIAFSVSCHYPSSELDIADLVGDFLVQHTERVRADRSPEFYSQNEFLRYAWGALRSASRNAYRKQSRRPLTTSFENTEEPSRCYEDSDKLFAVQDAIAKLDAEQPRLGRIVELITFQAISVSEASSILGVSKSTIRRDWKKARKWLEAELGFTAVSTAPAPDVQPPEVRLATFTTELYERLLANPSDLYSLNDEDFERLVADRFSSMGLEVKRVGPTRQKDGGIDIVAWPKQASFPFLVAAQVKHHHKQETKTKVSDVRDFHGVLTSSGAWFHLGFLVTSTTFTADAHWFANRNQQIMRLRDLADLCRWMRSDFATEHEWREIPDIIEVGRGVTIEIPKKTLWTPGDSS